jgi:2,4-dienoyl-CoA reductase-like NADH-dependent reductase (Old Yellow Enzyme family)/thioredoxin reductase
MSTNFGTEDGYVTQRQIDYYRERAKHVGVVIVEASYVEPRGKALKYQLSIASDEYVVGLRELADAIKLQGARAAIQLNHAGRAARPELIGCPPVAPSMIPMPEAPWGHAGTGVLPRALSKDEIKNIVQQFAEAAERAKRAGFEGIEIHAAHHYLLAQFLAPHSNRRVDEYGGNLENRARFLIEILHAIKDSVGDDFPVWVRINGKEYGIEPGISLEESKKLAALLEREGCDAIHVSAFVWGRRIVVPPMNESRGSMADLAAQIKSVVNIPVIAVGRIDPETGERILREGKADMVAMGRTLIADPDAPIKPKDERVPCIACMHCIERVARRNLPLECTVNPWVGREAELGKLLGRVDQPKKVVVIGGGVAGMQASLVVARRGHKVILYEKKRLGGLLHLAAMPPHKRALKDLISYYEAAIKKEKNIELRLEEATPQAVINLNPDLVIIATGSSPYIPEIKGLEKLPHFTSDDVLLSKAEIGRNVVVVGRGLIGFEVALYLSAQGRNVKIIEISPKVLGDASDVEYMVLTSLALERGIDWFTSARIKEVAEHHVTIINGHGKEHKLSADTVILATGRIANDKLYYELRGKIFRVYNVGDSLSPRKIINAIHEASILATSI